MNHWNFLEKKMVECVFRPWFYLGKNSEKHSLRTERSWTPQYHQAGGKKKIIERSFSLFYKILQVCLKEHPHEFSRYKSPCPKLFWSRNRTSDWTWRTQEGMPNIVVALFCQFILIPTSNQWGRHFSPCHPCYAGRTKKEVNQPKSHKARRDLQGLTPPRIRLGLGGYT